MDDANPNLLPPRQYILTDRVARGLGVFIFIASLLCVLFAATFPFDFSIPAGGNALQLVRETFDWQWVQYDPHYLDRTENILLFMPFGFGVASLFPQRRRFRFLLQIA